MNLLRVLTTLLSALCLASCAVHSVSDVQTPAPKMEYLSYVHPGQVMPLTEVTAIDGKQLSLTSPDKRKLVILFATWCSDSQRAMEALHASSLLEDPDLEIVAIGREEDVDVLEEFKQERGIKIELVADPERSIYKQFANAGIPRFIMVGKDNKIIDAVVAEGENQLDLIRWQ